MNVELLRTIQKHVLAEPRRIYMEQWCVRSTNAPCGTAACIAGWSSILGGLAKRTLDFWESFDGWFLDGSKILALTEAQANRLFKLRQHCSMEELKRGEVWPKKFEQRYKRAVKQETKAKVVAERIEHFIKTKGKE